VSVVLDASAILAALFAEEGANIVLDQMADAHLATVNLSEVLTKLIEYGLSPEQAIRQIGRLELKLHDFDAEQAERAAILREHTRQYGLSFGDRACLSLAAKLGKPVLTADRIWSELKLDIEIRQIR
jgi:ribonuclease VapC